MTYYRELINLFFIFIYLWWGCWSAYTAWLMFKRSELPSDYEITAFQASVAFIGISMFARRFFGLPMEIMIPAHLALAYVTVRLALRIRETLKKEENIGTESCNPESPKPIFDGGRAGRSVCPTSGESTR